MRTQLLAVSEEKETALAELVVARSGETMEPRGCARRSTACKGAGGAARRARLKAELVSERTAKEKLLIQARLDQAAATSREREHRSS